MQADRISAAPVSAINTTEAANRPRSGREAEDIMVPQPTDTAKTPTRPPHGCRCGARWFGAAIAHCAACHQTFGGVSSFDKHRAGTKDKTQLQGECARPSDIGLVQNERGVWGAPSNGVDFKAVFGSH
jgi:hypothetical protein